MMAAASSPAPPPSYWCYQCDRFVRATTSPSAAHQDPACPTCGGGFLEEMAAPPHSRAAAAYLRRPRASHHHPHAGGLPRRARRGAATDSSSSSRASPFNPVIVLRRSPPAATADPDDAADSSPHHAGSSFELFYDDGAGSGLRPLPDSMSDFLMGSGFERLLEQLAQIEAAGGAGALAARGALRDAANPPASKAAVDAMPSVAVSAAHVAADAHCAVCKDAFALGAEAREMPCAHIYHADCILPWLALRNSCPVCRHEMPTDAGRPPAADSDGSTAAGAAEEEATVGLTIWRLPGGGFAVGRFAGGRRPEERELPVVYTEMDGGFSGAGAPRRISWGSRQAPSSAQRGAVSRILRGVFACFGRRGGGSSTRLSRGGNVPADLNDDASVSDDRSAAAFSQGSRSRSTSWRLEDGHADAMVQR
ncbi:hypothetical protein U9M48_041518 [Paspalum notatum var. saurae]|uniref:RING-type E3 ubiquitin transferase n=1 Tax=Paspalum notatum var. saurae TaxID=547442 RepID=A0AAQ3XEY6_PASNO